MLWTDNEPGRGEKKATEKALIETDFFLQNEKNYIPFATLHCQVCTYTVISNP